MRRAWLSALGCGLAAALAGCTAPVVEMRLELPDPGATAGFDLSCVGSVSLRVIGKAPGDGHQGEVFDRCFSLTTTLNRFSDLGSAIHNQFAFDLPSAGLAGVQLTGFVSGCTENVAANESIFYGGAPYTGGTTMVVPVKPGVACNTQQTYQVRVLDLAGLYQSYAAQRTGATCVAPSDPVSLYAGIIRPRLLGDHAERMMLEYGSSLVPTGDGTGKLPSHRPLLGDPACVALGYQGVSSRGLVCVPPAGQGQGLCGAPGEIEIPELQVTGLGDSIDPALIASYGQPVIGAVWDASPRVPIAGATVELADPSQGKVVYVDMIIDPDKAIPSFRSLPPVSGATATAASGGFIVYLRGEATDVVVRAPDHVPQILRIASVLDGLPMLVVALERQSQRWGTRSSGIAARP